MPRPATSGNAAKGMYVKADFVFDAVRDVYVCPAGEDLTYRYTTEERGIQVRRYWINECKTCSLRTNCTTGTKRRISRWEHKHLVDEMFDRLGRSPDYMTLRRCTFEQPFGTIKAWMGNPHFLTRRLKNVRGEMALNVLAYNIKRMVALLGGQGTYAGHAGLISAVTGPKKTTHQWQQPTERRCRGKVRPIDDRGRPKAPTLQVTSPSRWVFTQPRPRPDTRRLTLRRGAALAL